jgi:hypothetical protein
MIASEVTLKYACVRVHVCVERIDVTKCAHVCSNNPHRYRGTSDTDSFPQRVRPSRQTPRYTQWPPPLLVGSRPKNAMIQNLCPDTVSFFGTTIDHHSKKKNLTHFRALFGHVRKTR